MTEPRLARHPRACPAPSPRAIRSAVATAALAVLLHGCGGGGSVDPTGDPTDDADSMPVMSEDDAGLPVESDEPIVDGVLATLQNRRDEEGFDLWGCVNATSDGPPEFYYYDYLGSSGRRASPNPNAPVLDFAATETSPGTLLLDYAAVGEQEELTGFRFDEDGGYTVESSSLGTLACTLAIGTVFSGTDAERGLLQRLANASNDDRSPGDVWLCGTRDDFSDFTLFVDGSVGRHESFHTTRFDDFTDVILLAPEGDDRVVLDFPDDPVGFTETLSAIAFDGPDTFTTESDFLGPPAVTCRRTPTAGSRGLRQAPFRGKSVSAGSRTSRTTGGERPDDRRSGELHHRRARSGRVDGGDDHARHDRRSSGEKPQQPDLDRRAGRCALAR